jgi:hypothetical protein
MDQVTEFLTSVVEVSDPSEARGISITAPATLWTRRRNELSTS